MSDVDIRITREPTGNLEAVAQLWKAMVDHHRHLAGHSLPIRDPDKAWLMRRQEYVGWLDDGSGQLLVARCGASDAVSGYAFVRTIASGPTFDFGGLRGEVESLVVAPAARGAGVGTVLLQASRRELQRRGCTYWSVSVMEANRGAVQLYERAGFRPWLRELAAPLDDPLAEAL